MQLADLAKTSIQLASTRSRRAKTRLLADCLLGLDADEVAIGVAYLSGCLPQGRIGIGAAALHKAEAGVEPGSDADTEARVDPDSALTLLETNRRLSAIATIDGAGSQARRHAKLVELLADAAEPAHRVALRREGGVWSATGTPDWTDLYNKIQAIK